MNDHPFRHVFLLILAGSLLSAPLASAQVQASPPLPSSPQPTRSQPLSVPPGSFLGGVPTGDLSPAALKISVVDAISRALEHNLGVLTAEQNLGKAEGARWRMLSELLPNVNGRVSETRQTINLAAFGFGSGQTRRFGNLPSIVGPFNVFDARVFLSQSVLDFVGDQQRRAEAHNVEASS